MCVCMCEVNLYSLNSINILYYFSALVINGY